MVGGSVIEDLALLVEEFGGEVKDFSYKIRTSQKYKDILIGYNIENLKAGKRPDGSDIEKIPTGRQKSSGYERQTVRRKQLKGQEYDHVTLYDTGSFYSALKAVSGSDAIYLTNTDSKAELLRSIWGDVVGITDEQIEEFFSILYEDYLEIENKKTRKI